MAVPPLPIMSDPLTPPLTSAVPSVDWKSPVRVANDGTSAGTATMQTGRLQVGQNDRAAAKAPVRSQTVSDLDRYMPHTIDDGEFEDDEWVRYLLASVIESTPYRFMIGAVILFDMVLLILDTDFRAMGREPSSVMAVSWYILLVIYAIELSVRIYIEQWNFPNSATNVFDFGIVVGDLALAGLTTAVGDLPSLTPLRGLRMLKFLRVLRGFMFFRELYLMIVGVIGAIRSIIFGFSLIFLTLTFFSILAVDTLGKTNLELVEEGAYDDCDRCAYAFSSVMASNLTFMQTILVGDEWGSIFLPLIERNPWTSIVILGAFLSAQMGLVNVIAAVMVDGQARARAADEQLQHQLRKEELQASYSRLRNLFASMDDDESGSLTVDELLESYDRWDTLREILDLMDISRKDLGLIFEIMDADGSGDVSYKEFVEQLHRIKTINPQTLLVFVTHHTSRLRTEMDMRMKSLTGLVDRLASARVGMHGEFSKSFVPDLAESAGSADDECRSRSANDVVDMTVPPRSTSGTSKGRRSSPMAGARKSLQGKFEAMFGKRHSRVGLHRQHKRPSSSADIGNPTKQTLPNCEQPHRATFAGCLPPALEVDPDSVHSTPSPSGVAHQDSTSAQSDMVGLTKEIARVGKKLSDDLAIVAHDAVERLEAIALQIQQSGAGSKVLPDGPQCPVDAWALQLSRMEDSEDLGCDAADTHLCHSTSVAHNADEEDLPSMPGQVDGNQTAS